MGTRSLTLVYDDDGAILANMYGHWDGGIESYGRELAEFINSLERVNGIGRKSVGIFNGMPCLAAQIVCQFKDGPGGYYLYPATQDDAGQSYTYHVHPNKVIVSAMSEQIFEGDWSQFLEFCLKESNG